MRRLKVAALAAAFVFLAFLVVRVLMPRTRSLSEIGRAVTPTHYSITGAWNQHLWLNDREQVLLGLSEMNVASKDKPAKFDKVAQCWRIDMQTGKTTRDRVISAALFDEHRRSSKVYTHAWQASPDGDWILCCEMMARRPPMGFAAISTSDGRILRWPRGNFDDDELHWSPDSGSWLNLPRPNTIQATLHDIKSAPQVTLLGTIKATYSQSLGLLADGRFIGADGVQDATKGFAAGQPVRLIELDLRSGVQSVHSVSLPVEGRLDCMALSNRGDRLAWLFDVTTMHTQSLLGRALALLGVRDSHHLSMWTSRTDGTGIKLVGDLELENPKSVSGAMSWAPDGKRVSFWANNKLWVIPVD